MRAHRWSALGFPSQTPIGQLKSKEWGFSKCKACRGWEVGRPLIIHNRNLRVFVTLGLLSRACAYRKG